MSVCCWVLPKMNGSLVFLCLLTIIVYLILKLSSKNFSYWKKKNVPYMKPVPILGNYGKYLLLQEYVGQLVQKLCRQFPNEPYFGAFYGTEPVLVVQSPELLKHILTKDFYYFNGREISKYVTNEIITKTMFFTSGNRWKIMRQNLTPLFSSIKIKNMFYLIEKCAYDMEDVLDEIISKCDVIEAKELAARYTMDCISSCAFGVESNTLKEPENNSFKIMADEIFRPSSYRGFKNNFRAVWPALFYGLGFKCFPDSIHAFFSQMMKGVFERRGYKPSTRNDFVDLLLHLKEEDVITCDSLRDPMKSGVEEKVHLKIDDEVLLALCVGIFGAGFETSATTLSFTLFEFAKNPIVQKRAAEEVDEFMRRHGNKLDYECISELPYLDACINEALRQYPVLGNLTREVMEDFSLPDSLELNKGLRVHVPVYALHYNPDHFPEPELYQPERFLPENRHNIKPYTFLPYGEGPRVCIGKRFSKMQIIPALITFLKNYRVELAEGMPRTVTFESRTTPIQPRKQGLMLKVSKRDGWEQRTFSRN